MKTRRISLQMMGISPAGAGLSVRSVAGKHGQEREGEHGQGRPAMPGDPSAVLVLVQRPIRPVCKYTDGGEAVARSRSSRP